MERYTWADLNPINWPRKKNIALAIDMILGWLCWLYWLKWLGLAYCCFAIFTAFFPVSWNMDDLDDGLLMFCAIAYHWCPDCGRTLKVAILNLNIVIHIPVSNTKKQPNGHNDNLPDHPAGTNV